VSQPYALRSGRLRLRPATEGDLESLLGIARDWTDEPQPPGTYEARRQRIIRMLTEGAEWWGHHGYGLWTLHDGESGRFVGFVGLRPGENPLEPELLYGLVRESRRTGLASEAARTVLTHLFARPEITGAWAAIDPTNERSARVLERLGMHFERRGELYGLESLIYRLPKAAWRDHEA
jgi:RimJ/RimL family protein N-acetyltransferase